MYLMFGNSRLGTVCQQLMQYVKARPVWGTEGLNRVVTVCMQ